MWNEEVKDAVLMQKEAHKVTCQNSTGENKSMRNESMNQFRIIILNQFQKQ